MHPINKKVYLILLSVAFNGLIKSQGARVKLMVCKTDSKKNAQKMLGNKNFFKQCKNQQLFKKILFFSFQLLQDFMQHSYRIFAQICELLIL
jgi:hypothetical protein